MTEHTPDRNHFLKTLRSPFPRLLGMEVVEVEPGRAVVHLPAAAQLLDADGQWHSGAVFALADTASGRAANSALDGVRRSVTLEMQINFISLVSGADCVAEARVIHQGRSSLIVECEVRTAGGEAMARTLATFIVLNPRPDQAVH